MLLYHGSTMAVRKPTVSRGRANTDFGKGFYTTKTAIERFGCTRLSAVISAIEKKHRELNIEHTRETVEGRYGNVSIARYKLGDN